MTEIVLEYGHCKIVHATVDPRTREVTFIDPPVTGKMWLILPDRAFVEIFEREGKYFLEPAA